MKDLDPATLQRLRDYAREQEAAYLLRARRCPPSIPTQAYFDLAGQCRKDAELLEGFINKPEKI